MNFIWFRLDLYNLSLKSLDDIGVFCIVSRIYAQSPLHIHIYISKKAMKTILSFHYWLILYLTLNPVYAVKENEDENRLLYNKIRETLELILK